MLISRKSRTLIKNPIRALICVGTMFLVSLVYLLHLFNYLPQSKGLRNAPDILSYKRDLEDFRESPKFLYQLPPESSPGSVSNLNDYTTQPSSTTTSSSDTKKTLELSTKHSYRSQSNTFDRSHLLNQLDSKFEKSLLEKIQNIVRKVESKEELANATENKNVIVRPVENGAKMQPQPSNNLKVESESIVVRTKPIRTKRIIEPFDGQGSNCDGGANPFRRIAIEQFVPPINSSIEDTTRWTNAVLLMKRDVSKLKFGGEPLRTRIQNELSKLDQLRQELFCKYL